MSPSGLTSNVIVEVFGSPCLVVRTNVTLRCQPDGVPRSKVIWFRDNFQLMPSNPRYLISNDSDFTITIINVVGDDAGTYTCNAMNTLTDGTVSEPRSDSVIFSNACGEFADYLNCTSALLCMFTHTQAHSQTSFSLYVMCCSAPYHCSSH